MIKLTFCLRRQPHLSREEFQTYWRETHAPLVASHAKALKIKRYVQTHAATHDINDALREGRGAPEQYDGIAELWWDDMETLAAATASKEGEAAGAALLEDERKFIDHAQSPIWLNHEHEVVS